MDEDIAARPSGESQGGQRSILSTNENTSGQGKDAIVPPEIGEWNWGAFLLGWIWGIGNSTYIAFLTLIPLVNVIMIFVLGAKGNEWAWKNKHWNDVEHFERVQRKWTYAGLIFFVVWIILFAALFLFLFRTIWNITEPPVTTADIFLTDLSSNQLSAAYALTSVGFQQSSPLSNFQSFVAANPILTEVKSESFNNRSIDNAKATITGTIVGVDGAFSPIRIVEVQEGGQWKIDYVDLQ